MRSGRLQGSTPLRALASEDAIGDGEQGLAGISFSFQQDHSDCSIVNNYDAGD